MSELSSESTTPRKQPFPGIGGSILLLVILVFMNIVSVVIAIPFIGLDNLVGGMDELPVWLIVFSYFFSFGGTVFIAYLITREPFGNVFRFRSFNWALMLPMLIALPGLWVVLFQAIAGITSFMPISEQFIEMMQGLFEDNWWVGLVVGVFGAAFLEEMLFRGVMLRGLLARMDAWKAVTLSAVLFGLAHMNPWQFVSAFMIGIVAGWIYHRTRSLWPCVLLHGANNLLVGFFGEQIFSALGFPEDVLESTVVPFMPWWAVLLGAVVMGAGLYGLNQVMPPAPAQDEDEEITLIEE